MPALIRYAVVFFALVVLPQLALAQNAYPIKGEDGSPVLNHKITPDLAAAAQTLPGAVIAGNPSGDVTLIEFYDLNCPYCRRASSDVDAILKEDKALRLVLVPFPVLGIPSILAGRVELAVAKQVIPQRFYEFHRKIYAGRGVIDGQRALAVAGEMKLDMKKLVEDADDDATTEIMKTHVRLGNKLDLRATPSYVVGDIAIVGHPGQRSLKAAIASMRKCGKAGC